MARFHSVLPAGKGIENGRDLFGAGHGRRTRSPLATGCREGAVEVLRGNAIATVDEKGRLKLPSIFRSAIEPEYGREFFVTSIRGDSVRIYPMEVWKRIEQKLARAPALHPAVSRFRKAVNYYGQSATMDPQGRILIHPLVRERAGTRGRVAVLGQHDYLEVWNHEAFERQLEAEPVSDEDLELLGRMGV